MATARSDAQALGDRLKHLRLEAGRHHGRKRFTQAEVATLIHESEGTISNWERGLGVTPEKVALIEAALSMDAGGRELGELPEDEPTVEAALAHVRAAYDLLRRLADQQRIQ